jgi:hypothetical protein
MTPSALVRFGGLATLLLGLAICAAPLAACSTDGSGDDDDSTECNGTACAAGEFCLYRACSAAESCVATTESSCPDGTEPAACSNGEPGCAETDCTVVQGCRTIPSGCSASDLACACASVCGSVAACASVGDGTVTCASS